MNGEKLGIGLYGANGHQIHRLLQNHPKAELLAHVGLETVIDPTKMPENVSVQAYDSLEAMLGDSRLSVISLCSPYRRDQARDAVLCLQAGKHVLAEKPCALQESDLDAIIEAAGRSGRHFREMSALEFAQPYMAMRDIVRSGEIGEIVQVFAQKSYPYHDRRPQDPDVDGGLVGQVGIYLLRFIEQVAMQRVIDVTAVETALGNPVPGGRLSMAATLTMKLENGGVACGVANYLNQPGFGKWGNDHLRLFGTKGILESTDGGARTRLVIGDRDCGSIDFEKPGYTEFDRFLDAILLNAPASAESLESMLHPTRMAIRAIRSAQRNR
ncbi:Gfo/Idh/MocA family protein [Paenibacillus koleovorans]|uniref:Gfo/Idh/MocA family protein n=1 Tax=Paenibacillus koleovorans TaxID=121608 RepID=UPI0013E332BC|nr:Gfo/Idh/MocA family oxidoreductase [Paenibacillus koleovorans]